MNAPVRAPRVAPDRFAALLAAAPAPVATGGVVRVAHCLERSAAAQIPTALREHLKGLEAEEGRVTWSKVDDGLWIRSVCCVERGPIDHALTRAFELAVAEGWLPAGAWRRVATKGALRCVEVGAGAPRGSLWIYAVRSEVTTRTLVLGTGEARYTRRREGTHYGPWEWATPRRAGLDVVDLAYVQFAAPDPVVALVPKGAVVIPPAITHGRATRADIEHVLRSPAACAAVVTRDVLVAWMRAQGWTLTYTAKNGVEVWYLSTKTAEIDRFVPGDHSAWENWPNTVIDALSAGRAAGDRTWWLDLADLWVASGGKR